MGQNKKQIETANKKDVTHYYNQTVLMGAMKRVIETSKEIFKTTDPRMQGQIANIKNNVEKQFNNLLKNVVDKEVYDLHLKKCSDFLNSLNSICLAITEEKWTESLVYMSKIGSWLNAQKLGKFNQFLWIKNGQETLNEYSINNDFLTVMSEGKPKHLEKVLIFTEEFEEGLLCYYDETKDSYYDDYMTIINSDDLYWLSIESLTATLKNKK